MSRGIITEEYTVWCGQCSRWDQQPGPSKLDAIKDWKRLGWQWTRKYGWLCSACVLATIGKRL